MASLLHINLLNQTMLKIMILLNFFVFGPSKGHNSFSTSLAALLFAFNVDDRCNKSVLPTKSSTRFKPKDAKIS